MSPDDPLDVTVHRDVRYFHRRRRYGVITLFPLGPPQIGAARQLFGHSIQPRVLPQWNLATALTCTPMGTNLVYRTDYVCIRGQGRQ